MRTNGTVELQTMKMGAYIASIPCYVCRGPNHCDQERCRHCFAPMAIAHQANSQKIQPQLLGVWSAPTAGKTTYLGMLTDILSRQYQGLQWLARGAFSVSLQQETLQALAECEFPAPTPADPEAWHWIHCQLSRPQQRTLCEFVLPDVAGTMLQHELDHPQSCTAIRATAEQATAGLILIDANRAALGGNREDFFTLKLLTFLYEMVTASPDQTWKQRPLAILFTKADRCEACRHDPTSFARELLPGVWQMCAERFPRSRFFATSISAGNAARIDRYGRRINIPLRIEPRGVVEPFRWLLEQLS